MQLKRGLSRAKRCRTKPLSLTPAALAPGVRPDMRPDMRLLAAIAGFGELCLM